MGLVWPASKGHAVSAGGTGAQTGLGEVRVCIRYLKGCLPKPERWGDVVIVHSHYDGVLEDQRSRQNEQHLVKARDSGAQHRLKR